MDVVTIGWDGFGLRELVAIARQGSQVRLSDGSLARLHKSRGLIEEWVRQERTVYGITTGFGALSSVNISRRDARRLQENILRSHAAGVGEPFDRETVRAIMALRIKDLCRGHSGIRAQTVQLLADMLNADICPLVPSQGSVGASGDLAPLAHLALALIGEGEVFYRDRRVPAAAALAACGLKPVRLEAAEGLALVNGTQVMTAVGGLCVYDAIQLVKHADIAATMSLEVLLGSRTEFDARIHQVRPHPGQIATADNMDRITRNSEIISSHKDCSRVQDAYTLRCSPQVHGASRDVIAHARRVLETEMNASTGNPLIFSDSDTFLLGGNFHGQPVALAMDFLAMGLAELANISERRIERLVNPKLSGLPAFLVSDGGLNSGFMIAQYTAAALVSENKVLAHPASVDSIPTSANKEDHVSMGTIAARKCRDVAENVRHVIAIELLCGAQAMDLFTNLHAGVGTRAAYTVIREVVPSLEKDRRLSPDIDILERLMADGAIIRAVEDQVGPLQ